MGWIVLYFVIALALGAAVSYFVEDASLIGITMFAWPLTLPIAGIMLGFYELEKLGNKRRNR